MTKSKTSSKTSQRTSQITKEELAKHNKPGDMWMSVYGRVYNLTKIFSQSATQHPVNITKYSGKDSTVEFFEAHPVPEFLLHTESIGTLALSDCERETLTKKVATVEFAETIKLGLKTAVDEYFTNYTDAQKALILATMTKTVNSVRDKYLKKLDEEPCLNKFMVSKL